ncbi:MAG: DAK2 domain-containing protein [Eubacteriales bacterium]|nr:DAK2 domain-containing protein [Eubacteriales bacterium]
MATTITGQMLKRMLTTGAQYLESRKQEINQLNVFPVPDGDTGTNMSLTALSSVKELGSVEGEDITAAAHAIAKGALRGARGNSGVILSQLFRGFDKGLKGAAEADAAALAAAFSTGVEMAYKAVMKPREGTILTVARAFAAGAAAAAGSGDIQEMFREALHAGQVALDHTPEQLEVLKKAGVVDAGGKGLLVIYEGCLAVLEGRTLAMEPVEAPKPEEPQPEPDMAELDASQEIAFGYCTEFFIVDLKEGVDEARAMQLRDELSSFGDSAVVVFDEDIIKVHVHSETPDRVLNLALRLGALDNLKIENMRRQHEEMLTLAAKKKAAQLQPHKPLAMVTVVAGEGLVDIFRDIMVDAFVEGGQTMNPSAEDIAEAIRRANADVVFVLPNNSNIIMAAQQASYLVECDVRVIPSKSVPQGVAAALTFDPEGNPDEIQQSMIAALDTVRSGQVTYAVRDTEMDGVEIHEGNIMGISAGKIQAVGADLNDTVLELIKKMAGDEGCEMISLYYGAEVNSDAAEALKARIATEFDDCDVEVYDGGQPVYYYLVSVE